MPENEKQFAELTGKHAVSQNQFPASEVSRFERHSHHVARITHILCARVFQSTQRLETRVFTISNRVFILRSFKPV